MKAEALKIQRGEQPLYSFAKQLLSKEEALIYGGSECVRIKSVSLAWDSASLMKTIGAI